MRALGVPLSADHPKSRGSAALAAGNLLLEGLRVLRVVQARPGRVGVHGPRAPPAAGVRAGVLSAPLQQPQRLLRAAQRLRARPRPRSCFQAAHWKHPKRAAPAALAAPACSRKTQGRPRPHSCLQAAHCSALQASTAVRRERLRRCGAGQSLLLCSAPALSTRRSDSPSGSCVHRQRWACVSVSV